MLFHRIPEEALSMDTNAVEIVAEAIKIASSQDRSPSIYVGVLVVAMLPTFAAIAAWIQAKATGAGVQEIHKAVNSERSAMIETVAELRKEIQLMAADRAKSDENQRWKDSAPSKSLPAGTVSLSDDQFRELLEKLRLQPSGKSRNLSR